MWAWAARPIAASAAPALASLIAPAPPEGRQTFRRRRQLAQCFWQSNPAPVTGAVSLPLHGCSKGKRIAILGGSFDPITNGHLVSACEILHAQMADEVWLSPCGVRPDKPSLKTPYRHRLIMCHLAVDTLYSSQFPMRVCDLEMTYEMALS